MSIFKECDIRGIYNEELNDMTAYDIGMAAGKIIDGKSVLVCGDVRKSTPALKENLINGLIDSGAQVIDMGLAPTPVFYFGKNYLNSYAGIMVTASHNPPQYNGFKVMFGDMPVTAADIKGIEKTIQSKAYIFGKGSITDNNKIITAYIDMLSELVGGGNLKVVIDSGDGTTSKIAPIIFRQHGYKVEELYCGWDGDFPNRNPNPAVYSNLRDLTEKVKKTKADIGIAFDGDGDRVVFVDENGEILPSEQSLVILLRKYLQNEKSSLVYDLKSSSIVASETRKMGSVPIMERSGHAFIKRTFKNNNSILAGEISGHFFFRELGQDDGIYAALKMCEIILNSGLTLSQLKSDIPKTSITPDIRIPIAYEKQDGIIDVLRQFSNEYAISEIDGIRVDFGYGWALVRKSVTEQAITLRVEAQTKEQVSDIIHKLIEKSPEFKVEQIKEYL